MRCRHGLPLWKLNSEKRHIRPDKNNQHTSAGVWRCLPQDWWTRNGKKEWDRENQSTTRHTTTQCSNCKDH
eukprot:12927588-Prorocentrum_lima.AAC.1